MQPADLQLYHKSAEKRGRVSIGQTPKTPAKAESKADLTKNLHLRQAAEAERPESPLLELSDGEELFADTDSSTEIPEATRIKVSSKAHCRQALLGLMCACAHALLLSGAPTRAAPYQTRSHDVKAGSC